MESAVRVLAMPARSDDEIGTVASPARPSRDSIMLDGGAVAQHGAGISAAQ
jgi:hypothetical protein